MEDDRTGQGGPPGQNGDMPPESLLPYDTWTEVALRQVMVRALQHAALYGLPGDHHFYLTFRTSHPGVSLPPRLMAQYPQEMTIVLQHQFWDLGVVEYGAHLRQMGRAQQLGHVAERLEGQFAERLGGHFQHAAAVAGDGGNAGDRQLAPGRAVRPERENRRVQEVGGPGRGGVHVSFPWAACVGETPRG